MLRNEEAKNDFLLFERIDPNIAIGMNFANLMNNPVIEIPLISSNMQHSRLEMP